MAAPPLRVDAPLSRVDALSRVLHLAYKQDAPAFDLTQFPPELAAALKAYDLDGDGTISVSEITAGANLLRRQREKARGGASRACTVAVAGGQLHLPPLRRALTRAGARPRRTPRSAR